MLIDQFCHDVPSPEHTHVLDEARVVDVPNTELLDVRIHEGGGGEDKCAEYCEELEADAEGMSPLGEAEVVGVRRSERFEIDRVQHQGLDEESKKT